MTTKSKARKRDLSLIANEIRGHMESTANIIAVGGLLLEAKKQLNHGEWLAWLDAEFEMSVRTAQNYMNAYRFSQKCERVADLKLRPRVLYALGGEVFSERVAAAILEEAKTQMVGMERAWELDELLMPTDQEIDAQMEAERQALEAERADAEAEANAILDGPAPDLPPPPATPSLLPREEFLVAIFERSVNDLKPVVTTPSSKFINAAVSPLDLQQIADLLVRVGVEMSKAPAT